MGNCCDAQEEEKPLLGSGPLGVRSGTLSQPPSGPIGVQSGTLPQSVTTEQPPVSARLHNPVQPKDFETSIELIAKAQLQSIPLPAIDKTFQDLARLYNEVVENFRSLETEIHRFKEYFVEETRGIPVLEECVKLLVKRLGQAKITVDRKSKNFIELTFDKQEVSKMCVGNAENSLMPLEHFSTACRHIGNILAHAPQVESNVKLILQDDEKLRKDIMKSDLPNEVMQQATKTFLDNVSKMRVVAAGTDTIKRDAEKKFKEFSKASQGFFDENES